MTFQLHSEQCDLGGCSNEDGNPGAEYFIQEENKTLLHHVEWSWDIRVLVSSDAGFNQGWPLWLLGHVVFREDDEGILLPLCLFLNPCVPLFRFSLEFSQQKCS